MLLQHLFGIICNHLSGKIFIAQDRIYLLLKWEKINFHFILIIMGKTQDSFLLLREFMDICSIVADPKNNHFTHGVKLKTNKKI